VSAPAVALELFYDGACPLCAREARALGRLDRNGRLKLTDLTAPGFDPAEAGVPMERLLARIHGRLPNGTIVEGVEVFRKAYEAAGLRLLVAPTRLPGISWLLDRAYDVFARNRLRLTGRCEDDACRRGAPTASP
jgi:predicted DCC family thiol-disulfide oxidoreductase YuxK